MRVPRCSAPSSVSVGASASRNLISRVCWSSHGSVGRSARANTFRSGMRCTPSLTAYRTQAEVGFLFSCLSSFESVALMAKARSRRRSGLQSKDLRRFRVAEWSSWHADEGATGSVPAAASHPCVPTEPPVSGLEAAPPAVRCVRSHGAVNRVVSPLRLFRPSLLGPRRTTRRCIEEHAPWTPAAIGQLCAPNSKLEAKKSRGRGRAEAERIRMARAAELCASTTAQHGPCSQVPAAMEVWAAEFPRPVPFYCRRCTSMERSERIVQSGGFQFGINTITTTATDACNRSEREMALGLCPTTNEARMPCKLVRISMSIRTG